ncbi:MAG: nitroreductase [Blastochloris sp.]|nr:nitroreductase [Blastochloris sp.]
MSLKDLILTRRTIGVFTDQPISADTVIDLLNTAVWTPNHRLTEPWRFVIMTGDGRHAYASIRREIAIESSKSLDAGDRQKAGDGTFTKFAAIPAYLVVIQKQSVNAEICEEDYAACAALIQNFMLLAWEQGIGTAWKTFKNDPRLRALFNLTADEKVVGIVHIGYPAEAPASQRQSLDGRITVLNHVSNKESSIHE